MQSGGEEKENKVISLAGFKKAEASGSKSQEEIQPEDPVEAFRQAMARNAYNRERLNAERKKANKSVLKSYRIKK